jgi:hypothetical protein
MVAELKMVCAERKCQIRNRPKKVKEVDNVAAVRAQIEVLTAKDQLI